MSAIIRETGIHRRALRAAIRSGRLPVRCSGQALLISREALESWIASCPTCAWPGCDRPGITPAGRCSREHGTVLPGWHHTAETRARMSATRTGVPRSPDLIEQIREGVLRFYQDDERSEANRQAKSAMMARSWETGEGAAPARVAAMGGPTRSKVFGRWAGQQAGRAGGRERGYSELQAKGVLKLKREDPTLGRRRLAKASGLSEKQVRAILEDDCG